MTRRFLRTKKTIILFRAIGYTLLYTRCSNQGHESTHSVAAKIPMPNLHTTTQIMRV